MNVQFDAGQARQDIYGKFQNYLGSLANGAVYLVPDTPESNIVILFYYSSSTRLDVGGLHIRAKPYIDKQLYIILLCICPSTSGETPDWAVAAFSEDEAGFVDQSRVLILARKVRDAVYQCRDSQNNEGATSHESETFEDVKGLAIQYKRQDEERQQMVLDKANRSRGKVGLAPYIYKPQSIEGWSIPPPEHRDYTVVGLLFPYNMNCYPLLDELNNFKSQDGQDVLLKFVDLEIYRKTEDNRHITCILVLIVLASNYRFDQKAAALTVDRAMELANEEDPPIMALLARRNENLLQPLSSIWLEKGEGGFVVDDKVFVEWHSTRRGANALNNMTTAFRIVQNFILRTMRKIPQNVPEEEEGDGGGNAVGHGKEEAEEGAQ